MAQNTDPPIKTASLRFKADNPGYWPMHCHVMSHALAGQIVILNVTNEGIPPVPDNFPTCPIHTNERFTKG